MIKNTKYLSIIFTTWLQIFKSCMKSKIEKWLAYSLAKLNFSTTDGEKLFKCYFLISLKSKLSCK